MVFPNNQLAFSTTLADWQVSKTAWKNYLADQKLMVINGVFLLGVKTFIISSVQLGIWSSDAQNDKRGFNFSLDIVSTSAASVHEVLASASIFLKWRLSHSQRVTFDFWL